MLEKVQKENWQILDCWGCTDVHTKERTFQVTISHFIELSIKVSFLYVIVILYIGPYSSDKDGILRNLNVEGRCQERFLCDALHQKVQSTSRTIRPRIFSSVTTCSCREMLASFPGRLPLHSLGRICHLWTAQRSRRRPCITSTSSNRKVDLIMTYVDLVSVIMATCPHIK